MELSRYLASFTFVVPLKVGEFLQLRSVFLKISFVHILSPHR